MIISDNFIRLNEKDTVLFRDTVTVGSNASIGHTFDVMATAFICGELDGATIEAKKTYMIPQAFIQSCDPGDGTFIANLGLYIELFIAEDLRRINPGVEIRVER